MLESYLGLALSAIAAVIIVYQVALLLLHTVLASHLGEALYRRLSPAQQQRLQLHLLDQLSDLSPAQWLTAALLTIGGWSLLLLLPLPWWLRLTLLGLAVMPHLQRFQQRQYYRRQVLKHWPAMLDVMAMTLHAGLSFRATLHALSETVIVNAAFSEINRMHRQQQAGFAMEEVLAQFCRRVPAPLTTLFKAAVCQSQRGGGALAETLQQQAQQARVQRLLSAEKAAQEAGVKLLLPLIGCFFPVTFLLILGPLFLLFSQGATS